MSSSYSSSGSEYGGYSRGGSMASSSEAGFQGGSSGGFQGIGPYRRGANSGFRPREHQGTGHMRRGYPPVHVPPAKSYPADPYMDQLSLPEALAAGTLFRWLYDPYEKGWQPKLR